MGIFHWAWVTIGPGLSYQEKLIGNQAYFIFALSIILVFLVLRRTVRELD